MYCILAWKSGMWRWSTTTLYVYTMDETERQGRAGQVHWVPVYRPMILLLDVDGH